VFEQRVEDCWLTSDGVDVSEVFASKNVFAVVEHTIDTPSAVESTRSSCSRVSIPRSTTLRVKRAGTRAHITHLSSYRPVSYKGSIRNDVYGQ
jgi:hypothetical protein